MSFKLSYKHSQIIRYQFAQRPPAKILKSRLCRMHSHYCLEAEIGISGLEAAILDLPHPIQSYISATGALHLCLKIHEDLIAIGILTVASIE